MGHLPAADHRPPHAQHGPGRLDGRPDRHRQPAGQAPVRGAVAVPYADPQPVHVRRHPAPARLRHLRARLQRPPDHRRRLRAGALVAVTLVADPPAVAVRLEDGAESGLASIVQQYLEQDLAEFADKRRLAQRLRGRLAMTADGYGPAVTVGVPGEESAIWGGERPPP